MHDVGNVLFMGPPGVGKSHLVAALGVKSTVNGLRTTRFLLDELMRMLKGDVAPRKREAKRYPKQRAAHMQSSTKFVTA